MSCYVISVLNQKGGVGKTTLSVNLAGAFHETGVKVMLVDSDPQGSARDWHAASEGTSGFPVIGLDRDTLATDLPHIVGDHQLVIIDGAPQVTRLAAAAIKTSDLILIPVQPSPYDLWAAADLVDLVKTRMSIDDNLRAAFLVSRAIKGTKLSGEVAEVLKGYELPVLNSGTTQRVAYASTASEGKTVLSEASAASDEIRAIRTEVCNIMNI